MAYSFLGRAYPVSVPVQNILKILDEDATLSPKKALEVITKKYGRKAKEERSAIQVQDILEQKRNSLLPQLKDLNMIEGAPPQKKLHDYTIILGATLDQNVPLKNLNIAGPPAKDSMSMHMDNLRNTLQREIEVFQRISALK